MGEVTPEQVPAPRLWTETKAEGAQTAPLPESLRTSDNRYLDRIYRRRGHARARESEVLLVQRRLVPIFSRHQRNLRQR